MNNILVAPNKSIAIIEFQNEIFAENAFKNLSYFVFKNNPLYLEWAPENFLNTNMGTFETKAKIEEENDLNHNVLFVKNLNFETKENSIENAFCKIGAIKSVKIVKKNGLSSGYGFIEFTESASVQQALKKFQGFILDEHSLQLSVSKPKKENPKNKKNKSINDKFKNSNKILIRNIPFEATKNDIKNLFKAFGETKAIRLPRKMNNQHR